jgi:hypothetical protein
MAVNMDSGLAGERPRPGMTSRAGWLAQQATAPPPLDRIGANLSGGADPFTDGATDSPAGCDPMNEAPSSPPADAPAHDRSAINRLLLFFAIVYVVEGLGQVGGLIAQPLSYYLKQEHGWTPSQVSAYLTIFNFPWIIKPVYGVFSDFVPLFGYRRKGYLVAANIVATGAFLWVTQLIRPATWSGHSRPRPMPWRSQAPSAARCWWRTGKSSARAAASSTSNGSGSTSPPWRAPSAAAR